MGQVLRYEVGQIAVLVMVAALLNRVEFRGIGWQPLELKPLRMHTLHTRGSTPVNTRSAPDQNDLVAEIAVHFMEEPQHVLRMNVVREQRRIVEFQF